MSSRRTHRDTRWAVIDRWVRDSSVRRDALIALAMLLVAGVVIALVMAVGIQPMVHSPIMRTVFGSLTTGGLGWLVLRMFRRRR